MQILGQRENSSCCVTRTAVKKTVTDIVSWHKDYRRIEHLGWTLADSKQLLKLIQKKLLQEQIDRYLQTLCLPKTSSGLFLQTL